ncbi:MAG: ABC transporter permease, partial [Lachnospiraceae bacterium]|nr:ABC transporter permease [Lachnospiraceae bacterium]
MIRVKNKKILHLLAVRFMKMNRKRNIIAIIAIALTGLLFTSAFTGAYSMYLSNRSKECRDHMCFSHAAAFDMTEKEVQKGLQAIEDNDDVARYGKRHVLGNSNRSKIQ